MPLDSFSNNTDSNNTDTLSDIVDRLDAQDTRSRVRVVFSPLYFSDQDRWSAQEREWEDEDDDHFYYVHSGQAEAEAIQEEMEANSPRYGKKSGENVRYMNRNKMEDDKSNSRWKRVADKSTQSAKRLRTQEKEVYLNGSLEPGSIDLLHEWDTQFAEVTPEDLAAENRRNLDL